jgi:glycyl-tRNA synthetase
MSQGWVECVGHADRSAFDLKVHTAATKVELIAREIYPAPREEDVVVVKANKGLMGKHFKGDNAAVVAALEELQASIPAALALEAALAAGGSAPLPIEGGSKTVTLTRDMLSLAVERKKVSEKKYVPNVIEPSFGIGRIITGVFEHCFYVRPGDEQRAVLAFPPAVAPCKVLLLPLDGRISAEAIAPLAAALTAAGLANAVDDSGASVGRRYARADEVGTPFAVTFDHQTAADGAVTLRERDSTMQVRLPVAEVAAAVGDVVAGRRSWAQVTAAFTVIVRGDATEEEGGGGGGGGGGAPAAPVNTAGGFTLPEGGVSQTGSRGVKVEGQGRTFGRFARPADL